MPKRRLSQTTSIKLLDYDSLLHFIKDKMSMTHVYQPIMIRTLLESEDCKATREAIARQFLGMDESQLNYYKAITARWPHKTLKGHGIVGYERRGQIYTLLLDGATAEQKRRLADRATSGFTSSSTGIRRYGDSGNSTGARSPEASGTTSWQSPRVSAPRAAFRPRRRCCTSIT